MKIAVAVDGSCRDAAVLSWAAWFARPGDDVHVVHAYQELSVGGSAWLPAVRANDHRRYEARRIVTLAQSVLHAALHHARQVSVGGSAIVGWPHAVLTDLSSVADLLVVGSRSGPGPVCAVDAACPVVVVPTAWSVERRRGRSVGVVCGRELSASAMDRAVDYARRAGMTVVVLQSEGDLGDAARTERLERLGLQVAGWERPDGPPIVAEIRRGPLVDGLRSLTHVVGLLVVDAAETTGDATPRVALDELALPVALVGGDRSASETSRAVGVLLTSP